MFLTKKEINYHRDNSCSIFPIEQNYPDRLFIKDILENLISECPFVTVKAQRPFYLPDLSLKTVYKTSYKNLSIDGDFFSLSFTYTKDKHEDDFSEACINIWFDYEHVGFFFFKFEKDLAYYHDMNWMKQNMSWDRVTRYSSCYVVFRGAEDSVLWIGKSKDLEFDISGD